MNKNELVAQIAEKAGLTKADSELAYNAVFEAITDALAAGEKVVVSGFGTFEVKERVARKGHDPRTNEIIAIPGYKAATFKVGKILKDRVK